MSTRDANAVSCRMGCPYLLPVLAAGVILATPDARLPAQAARYLLTSVDQNIDVGDWQIGGRETGIAPDALQRPRS
jgi:hypothetical protein